MQLIRPAVWICAASHVRFFQSGNLIPLPRVSLRLILALNELRANEFRFLLHALLRAPLCAHELVHLHADKLADGLPVRLDGLIFQIHGLTGRQIRQIVLHVFDLAEHVRIVVCQLRLQVAKGAGGGRQLRLADGQRVRVLQLRLVVLRLQQRVSVLQRAHTLLQLHAIATSSALHIVQSVAAAVAG